MHIHTHIHTPMIRVGRCEYTSANKKNPSFDGYELILVMTKSYSKWYPLSPYELRKDGKIFENIWQSCKVYNDVPKSRQTRSAYTSQVIWEWPAETHVTDGRINEKYIKWRNALSSAEYPVRYPVGFTHRHKCIYALLDVDNPDVRLDYIEARKQIYLALYVELVRHTAEFKALVDKVRCGHHILIAEVDGPHQESLSYYKNKYGVDDNFITRSTILATPQNLGIMLNDTKHPFGHGYCLAWAILQELGMIES